MADWFAWGYLAVGAVAFVITAFSYVPPNGSYHGYEREWSMEWFAFFCWPAFVAFFVVISGCALWWRLKGEK